MSVSAPSIISSLTVPISAPWNADKRRLKSAPARKIRSSRRILMKRSGPSNGRQDRMSTQ